MKIFFLTMCMISCGCACFGQIDSISQAESTRIEQPPAPIIKPPVTIQLPAPVKKKPADSFIRKAPVRVLDTAAINKARLFRDSVHTDSLKKAVIVAVKTIARKDTSTYKKYEIHPYLPMNRPAVFMLIDHHKRESKDDLFYIMAGVLLCLAFIKTGFPKYFRNLFLLFFQTSLRQKQTRDQLLQDNLASLFINLLFFISTGLYIALLIKYNNWSPAPFWILAVVCGAVLVLIYLGKYLFLLFSGWVFNTREAAGSYVFLVFLVNKVMGVLLIPFLLILAFASSQVVAVAVIASFFLIGILFVYRYFVSFSAIRNKLKVNALHFFLYLCAVEVLPLLLIYKLLINYIGGSF